MSDSSDDKQMLYAADEPTAMWAGEDLDTGDVKGPATTPPPDPSREPSVRVSTAPRPAPSPAVTSSPGLQSYPGTESSPGSYAGVRRKKKNEALSWTITLAVAAALGVLTFVLVKMLR